MMANKLKVIQQKCNSNKKKTKIIQNNLMKINNIKESFKQNKLQVLDHLKLD